MVVDDAFPAVHEKAHFTQAAAALHELPGVCPGLAYARALEDEIRQAAAVIFLHRVKEAVQVRVMREIIRARGAHFLSQFQAGIIAVHGDDGFNAQRAQRGDLEQADRAAALHEHHGIELEQSGGLGAFQGMDHHGGGLHQNALVQRHAGNVEKRGTLADDQVLPEVAVQMHVVVRHQAVHAHVLAQVGAGRGIQAGVTGAAGDDAGDDLVPQGQGIARRVLRDIPAHGDDFPGAFMAQHHGAEAEGVPVVLVAVRAANAAGFHLDQHFIIPDGGNGVFTDFKCLGSCQDSGACGLLHSAPTLPFAV